MQLESLVIVFAILVTIVAAFNFYWRECQKAEFRNEYGEKLARSPGLRRLQYLKVVAPRLHKLAAKVEKCRSQKNECGEELARTEFERALKIADRHFKVPQRTYKAILEAT